MRSRLVLLLLALALGALAAVGSTPAQPTLEPARSLPRFVTTTQGEQLDLEALARQHSLVVVTLKATWCPVCRTQLRRLQARLPELRACGVRFLVLAPGSRDEVEQVRVESGFPYPFVADPNLAYGRRLDLVLGPEQLAPALFVLGPDLRMGWLQRGRSGRFYGDGALLRELRCEGWI